MALVPVFTYGDLDGTLSRRSQVPVSEPPTDEVVLFEQDFSTVPLGTMTSTLWNTHMLGGGSGGNNPGMVGRHECKVNPDLGGRMLDLTLLAGFDGGAGSSSLYLPLPQQVAGRIKLTLRFKLVAPYDLGKGQKFPGFTAVRPGIAPSFPTGGNTVVDEGWSVRGMQATHSGNPDGTMLTYIYGSDVVAAYGEDGWWTSDGNAGTSRVQITDGTWHEYVLDVTPNTITSGTANSDGIIRHIWNGVTKYLRTNRKLRTRSDVVATHLLWHWFYGGDETWAPETDQHIWIDYVKVTTEP